MTKKKMMKNGKISPFGMKGIRFLLVVIQAPRHGKINSYNSSRNKVVPIRTRSGSMNSLMSLTLLEKRVKIQNQVYSNLKPKSNST